MYPRSGFRSGGTYERTLVPVVVQCHAEGGGNKEGRKQMRANANKHRQTSTNASKRRGENASKRKQTRANVDKSKQTLTPPFIAVFKTPLQSPYSFRGNIRTYPRSGFRSGGTSAKTTVLETTLLGSSENYQSRNKAIHDASWGPVFCPELRARPDS